MNLSVDYSFGEPNEKDVDLLDIEINNTNYGGRHRGGFQYELTPEIGPNNKGLTIGPKISGV